jgi:hypothetical protein
MSRKIFQFFHLSDSVGGKNRIWKRTCVIGLASALALAWNVPANAATIFMENFESGLGSWTSNAAGTTAGNPQVVATPSAPPDAPGSTLSFTDPDGAIVRIGRGFTTNAAATSVKLTWYMYSTSNTSSQRYYGQLSSGTAAAPGTGSGTFARVAANNDANSKYHLLYSNGATQTVVTPNTITAGWHKIQLTVTPGTAGVGSYVYQVDANPAQTVTSTATIGMPTNVQFGQTVSNGTAGGTDTTAYFDSVLVEQFAPAATKPTNENPTNGSILVGLDDNLAWTPGTNNTKYDVFFDVTPTLTTPVSSNQVGTSFDPGTLLPNTTYYWRVDAKNVLDDAVTGDLWSFTTVPAIVPEPGSLTLVALMCGGLLAAWRRRK